MSTLVIVAQISVKATRHWSLTSFFTSDAMPMSLRIISGRLRLTTTGWWVAKAPNSTNAPFFVCHFMDVNDS
jgi:hypothetical protein